MKKVILSLAFVAVAIVGLKAQDHGSANVKVNVILNPVLTISLGSGATSTPQDVVNLEYITEEDYVDGVTETVANQLKVTSIGSGYKLSATVSSASATVDGKLIRDGGTESFEASELLKISIEGGTEVDGGATMSFGNRGVSTAAGSVLAEELDVTYIGTSFTGKEGLLRDMLADNDTNAVTYSADVVYTVLPQ